LGEEMQMSETIGMRLRSLRKDRGLSAEAVASTIHMHVSHLFRVEKSEREPGLFMAIELAKVYGVSIDYIAGLAEREQNPYVRRAA
jgi:transcriptional regulator with XRE-family HTH domain